MQHEIGTIIDGKVTGITKFGAFVQLADGAVGMIHISEVAGTYVNDISEHLKEQQEVKVKILNVGEDGKISLSIKKALPQQQTPQRFENRSPNTQNKPNQQPRNNNFNRNNNNNRGGTSVYRPSTPQQPATFDDMISKFLQTSDEKTSDMRRDKSSRRAAPKRSRNYD